MHSKVSSDWLSSYIKATRPVLGIFKMYGYFPDMPRIFKCRLMIIVFWITVFKGMLMTNARVKALLKTFLYVMVFPMRKLKMVKVTLLQTLRLCTGRTAHRGSRGIALLFHDHGSRRGWVVNVTPRPLFTPGKVPVLTVQETVWAPGPVWTGAKNLTPTGIRSLDRPARNQSLYRLNYPAHFRCVLEIYFPRLYLYVSECTVDRWIT